MHLGRNQADLARVLGLTFQQVQKYEKGANRVSASKLWAISQYLEVSPDHFFQGLTGETPGEDGGRPAGGEAPRRADEISRLAPRLSRDQQKLVLEFIHAVLATRADS